MPRRDAGLRQRRHGGERECRLGDVVLRLGLDARREFRTLRSGGMRPDQHAVAAGAPRQLHHQLIEIIQHIGAVLVTLAQEGRHVLQQRLFAQVEADHLRHEGIDRLVVRNPRPRRIGQRHVPRAIGGEDAGHAQHALGLEDARVQVVVIHAAIQHVHTLRPGGGAHEDDVVLHEQVGAFHHLHAHLIGQEAVLVIGAVEMPGRQDGDAGRALAIRGGGFLQRLQQLFRIMPNRREPMVGTERREQPQHRLPVFQHVGDAGGRAAIILQHVEIVGAGAHQVDAGDVGEDAGRRPEALHRAAIGLVVGDQRGRHAPGAHDLLPGIDIADEGVQRLHALRQAARQAVPFAFRQDARDDVEGDQPFRIAALAIDGEGDADAAEQRLRLRALGRQRGQTVAFDPGGDALIGRPDAARGVHLVEGTEGVARLGHVGCPAPLLSIPCRGNARSRKGEGRAVQRNPFDRVPNCWAGDARPAGRLSPR